MQRSTACWCSLHRQPERPPLLPRLPVGQSHRRAIDLPRPTPCPAPFIAYGDQPRLVGPPLPVPATAYTPKALLPDQSHALALHLPCTVPNTFHCLTVTMHSWLVRFVAPTPAIPVAAQDVPMSQSHGLANSLSRLAPCAISSVATCNHWQPAGGASTANPMHLCSCHSFTHGPLPQAYAVYCHLSQPAGGASTANPSNLLLLPQLYPWANLLCLPSTCPARHLTSSGRSASSASLQKTFQIPRPCASCSRLHILRGPIGNDCPATWSGLCTTSQHIHLAPVAKIGRPLLPGGAATGNSSRLRCCQIPHAPVAVGKQVLLRGASTERHLVGPPPASLAASAAAKHSMHQWQ